MSACWPRQVATRGPADGWSRSRRTSLRKRPGRRVRRGYGARARTRRHKGGRTPRGSRGRSAGARAPSSGADARSRAAPRAARRRARARTSQSSAPFSSGCWPEGVRAAHSSREIGAIDSETSASICTNEKTKIDRKRNRFRKLTNLYDLQIAYQSYNSIVNGLHMTRGPAACHKQ